MAYIPAAWRKEVIYRAQGLCEYCQTAQAIVLAMEIDHIIPVSAGGENSLDNLCLACVSCNKRKHDAMSATDPESQTQVPLFNPRTDSWNAHFQWSPDGIDLIGLTPTGRATIQYLKINREDIRQARKRWSGAGWHPPT